LSENGVGNDGTGNALSNVITGSVHDNVLNGDLGADTMSGWAGNDQYYVDSEFDIVIENVDEGNDTVFSTVNHTLSSDIETLSLDVGNAVSGTGNAHSNTIFGNAGDNILNGRGSTDQLNGLGGNDTFVFEAGEANGDTVYEFAGNGAGTGDVLLFQGYGTLAQGATFQQVTATDWLITSADGLIQETVTLAGAPAIDASDFVFV
jgi:Ca2+-binding RTX toxin-like protein